MDKLTGKRLLLLMLYAPTQGTDFNVPIAARTRLMKMAFLFQKEVLPNFRGKTETEPDIFEFFAWKYGPFSAGLMDDLEFLLNQGFVSSSSLVDSDLADSNAAEYEEYHHWVEEDDQDDASYDTQVFSLTQGIGVSRGQGLWTGLTTGQQQMLETFKKSMVRAKLDEILEYVYRKYPDLAAKSCIKNRY